MKLLRKIKVALRRQLDYLQQTLDAIDALIASTLIQDKVYLNAMVSSQPMAIPLH
jgi:hypothetical protein